MIKHIINQTCCQRLDSVCQIHSFQLLDLSKSTETTMAARVQCCPVFSQRLQSFENIFPIFNNDAKYYTAAFVLPIDEHYHIHNHAFQKERFDSTVHHKLYPNQKLYLPQPCKPNQFCHVCRFNYQDYKEHISTDQHKAQLRLSRADLFIHQLCRIYKKQTKQHRKQISQSFQASKGNRCSMRLRKAEESKKYKQQIMSQFSTMTSQKQLKCEEQNQLYKQILLKKTNKKISKTGVHAVFKTKL